MIKIALVEDDDAIISQLKEYVQQYQETIQEELNLTIYHDGDEITSKYKSQFDLILMDIQMKFVDGMTAAEEIRRIDSEVMIIFVTNMTQYAIQGYKVGAMDYILKPVSYFSFCKHLGDAIARIKKRNRHYVTIPVKNGVLRLDVADIYYIESQGHNLIYHTRSGEHIASGTMQAAEQQFENYGFSRGNKGYLINLAHVDGVQDKCALVKGESLQLSRPRHNAFLQDLMNYWSEH